MLLMFITIIFCVLACTVYLMYHFQKWPILKRLTRKKWLRKLIGMLFGLFFFFAAFFPPNELMPLFLYMCMGYVVVDAISLLRKDKWLNFRYFDVIVFGCALIICVYGYWNARQIKVRHFKVELNKPLESPVRLIFISDIHLGSTLSQKEFEVLCGRIKELKPDLITLGGDIYDESSPEDLKEYSYAMWQKLMPRYGIYYITGNHEHSSHGPGIDLDLITQRMTAAGVTILMDRAVMVNNGLQLIGRLDSGQSRKSLAELTNPLDKSKPVILLDHRPEKLTEARDAGVDIQLSGHTHGGQLFPFNFVVGLLFENSNGHKNQNEFHSIVSTGLGTWRIPIRTGSSSEFIVLDISGKK